MSELAWETDARFRTALLEIASQHDNNQPTMAARVALTALNMIRCTACETLVTMDFTCSERNLCTGLCDPCRRNARVNHQRIVLEQLAAAENWYEGVWGGNAEIRQMAIVALGGTFCGRCQGHGREILPIGLGDTCKPCRGAGWTR